MDIRASDICEEIPDQGLPVQGIWVLPHAWKACLSEAPEYVVTLGTTLEAAYEDMKAYLEGKPALPTAYFADNDVIALGAMRAWRKKESKYRIRSLSWDSTISVLGPYPPRDLLQSMYTSRRWERWR